MKKKCFIIFFITGFVLAFVSGSFAATFTEVQLTENDAIVDDMAKMNENNHVVWVRSDTEIYQYDGSDISQVVDSDCFMIVELAINDNGEIVWIEDPDPLETNDYKIFLYDGTTTTLLADSAKYGNLDINNSGQVVWVKSTPFNSGSPEIFMYDGTAVIQLTDDDYADSVPKINDDGHIVWAKSVGETRNIYLFDGTTTTRISETGDIMGLEINSEGYVVWGGREKSGYYQIFFYDGNGVTQLTENDFTNWGPKINDNGYIVWQGVENNPVTEIFLYDGNAITQLTENDFMDQGHVINNSNQVVWMESGEIINDEGDFEKIFFYDGDTTTQLEYSEWSYLNYLSLNDNQYIVWAGSDGSDLEIFLAVPFGTDVEGGDTDGGSDDGKSDGGGCFIQNLLN